MNNAQQNLVIAFPRDELDARRTTNGNFHPNLQDVRYTKAHHVRYQTLLVEELPSQVHEYSTRSSCAHYTI